MDKKHLAVAETVRLLSEIREGFGIAPTGTRQTFEKFKETLAAPPSEEPLSFATTACAPSVVHETSTVSVADKRATWEELRKKALVCVKCPHLAGTRKQVVFGVGNIDAELMFVGEAPGADEDEQGEPFVGRAGQLLTKIIEAMGFRREDIYIGNVLKCRPDMPAGSTGNRKPRPEEMETCLPWLKQQIALIRPKVIVALGATAVEGLLKTSAPMRELRGKWLEFESIPTMVTYHPAYLLRNQTITEKRKVWEDMLLALEKLGKPISEKQRNFFKSAGN